MTAAPVLSFGDPLTAVAGYGIPGSVTSLPLEPLPDPEWEQLVDDVRRHRVLSLLAAAVSQEAVPVTAGQGCAVDVLMTETHASTQRHVDALVTTVELLSTAGVETRVLDGAAVAHLDYRNPSLRPVADVELLVQPASRDRAVTLLTARGYTLRAAPLATHPERPAPSRLTTPAGTHVTLVDRLGWLRAGTAAAWGRAEPFAIEGHRLHALAREERLVDSCCRAGAQPQAVLRARRDVAEAALHDGLDPERVVALAHSCGAASAVAEAVRATWSELRLADVVALSTWSQSWHGRRGGAAPGAGISGAFERLVRALSLRTGPRP